MRENNRILGFVCCQARKRKTGGAVRLLKLALAVIALSTALSASRLLAQTETTPSAVPVSATPAAAARGCALAASVPVTKNETSIFTYTIRCETGITPKAMSISTSAGKSFVASEKDVQSPQGIEFKAYDSKTSTVTFSLSAGAAAYAFAVSGPNSAPLINATYYIASDAVSEAANCQGTSAPATGCSIGTISLPAKNILAKGCGLAASVPVPNNDTNTFTYTIHCDTGVTPNAMAIYTSAGKSFVASAKDVETPQGIAFKAYDSKTSAATFTLSAAPPYTFTVSKPSSDLLVTATYYIASGDVADATICQGTSPPTTGCSNGAIPLPVKDRNAPIAILIGGAEYSAYSAQSQTEDAFLNIFYRGPISAHGLSGWTRVRLTSLPQQATNGVVSVVSNPTGLSSSSYSNVGQAFDYVFGAQQFLSKNSRNWSIVAGLGATTPLSTQNAPVTYAAPPPGEECNQLVSQYSPAHGYSPGLVANPAMNPTTCLANGYTAIAFTNQDRSSMFLKYGAGLRTTYPWKTGSCDGANSDTKCSTAYAALDATIGQDSAVTGGVLHGFVFKLDGILPIPTKSVTWLYLFGSSYIRLLHDVTEPALPLSAPNPPVSVPSANVFVLPLRQPNKDYYRLGVGININQIWCKWFGNGCSTSKLRRRQRLKISRQKAKTMKLSFVKKNSA